MVRILCILGFHDMASWCGTEPVKWYNILPYAEGRCKLCTKKQSKANKDDYDAKSHESKYP